MNIDFSVILNMAVPAAVVYAAIRADLARIHERSTNAQEDAKRANRRIDDMIDKK